jgi:predicted porin
LAATSAFAQSAVTLTGNLDFAYGTASAAGAASEKTITTRDLTSSTSVIKITAVEDLGGGTKATVQYGLDPRKLARDQAVGFTSDETFVGLAGSMGNLRLGSPNSIGLTTFGASTPFGTGIGGGYAHLASVTLNQLVTTAHLSLA